LTRFKMEHHIDSLGSNGERTLWSGDITAL
jgi:hypothetical protein